MLDGYQDQVVSVLSGFTWGTAVQQFMIKLRRIKQNLKSWNKTRQTDNVDLATLEQQHNDKLLAVDNQPLDVLVYDDLC